MTGILLLRHAAADPVGRVLAGRRPGVHLNDAGRAEAAGLAKLVASVPLEAVYSSPLERALETAEPVARAHGLGPRVAAAFEEVDFGGWTGRSLDALEGDPGWERWNTARGSARPPGGESMQEVLERALRGVGEIADRHGSGWVAVVSHCDVIRPVLAHFLGLPLDHLLRLEVGTASVSTLAVERLGGRVLGVNQTPAGPWPSR